MTVKHALILLVLLGALWLAAIVNTPSPPPGQSEANAPSIAAPPPIIDTTPKDFGHHRNRTGQFDDKLKEEKP